MGELGILSTHSALAFDAEKGSFLGRPAQRLGFTANKTAQMVVKLE